MFSSNNMFCNVWRGRLYFHRNWIEIAETSTSKQTMLYLFDIDLVISFFSANIIFGQCQDKQWGKGSTTNSMWFFSELKIEIYVMTTEMIVRKNRSLSHKKNSFYFHRRQHCFQKTTDYWYLSSFRRKFIKFTVF